LEFGSRASPEIIELFSCHHEFCEARWRISQLQNTAFGSLTRHLLFLPRSQLLLIGARKSRTAPIHFSSADILTDFKPLPED
jgi:hypothetical protein